MKRLTLLLPKIYILNLCLLLHHTLARFSDEEKCVIDNRSTENKGEYQLIKDLHKCGYNPFQPPPSNGTEPLPINVFFAMKSFKFDSELQEFSTFMWTILVWKDERLKWDPTKYSGVKNVIVPRGHLWAPGFMQVNNIGEEYDQSYIYATCEMKYTGAVRCIAWLVYEAKCGVDLKDWPYDAQYCKLEFGVSNSEAVNKIILEVSPKAITMIGAEYGTEWDIMDYQQTENQTSEALLTMKFRLERHAAVLAAIVIYPSLILSTLTFSSLFLDARLNLRLLVICFSLMCHNYFITDLSFEIPENTKDPPGLLMYYRGSFVLTSILLVVSFALNAICRREVASPRCITVINDFVFLTFVKFVIWPRWETKLKEEGEADASNFVKFWTDFANIVNTVCLFMSVVVYISLYCMFMPQPIPF